MVSRSTGVRAAITIIVSRKRGSKKTPTFGFARRLTPETGKSKAVGKPMNRDRGGKSRSPSNFALRKYGKRFLKSYIKKSAERIR